ncbi:MAG: hypothetical protein AVDCRST_MAG37-3041 [uncultured Rubrobacteraceae bacterium]|uniref:Uncharacterized protein n=1 Tax=uncultured Rubrobacteraceae bacterium TaxID=349277 RepID=A0A6J4QZY7_9ACTN|nr:MAG: hypothetical protein AVDCRST_MAG37-3041 [uncultured Rubrobacteraceae bacterium]
MRFAVRFEGACHKDKKTIMFGASVLDVHVRHGDTPGECR